MTKFENVQLFTPGPVNVPPNVLAAGARPMLHHRTPEFSEILKNLLEKMKVLVGTKKDILPVHTSGRGAMEGVILNLFSAGDEIACVCNGKFGEMFANIAEMHSLKVHRICKDWLKEVNIGEIEKTLKDNKNIKAVTVCQCETTTAMVADIEKIGKITKKYKRALIVDGVSSVGCLPMQFDKWGVDALVTASQKGLMAPTGLAFVALSDKAWKLVETSTLVSYYIQFKEILKNVTAKNPETPGSTPVSLVCSVEESLNMISEEGKENVFARHEKIAKAIRKGLVAMGVELFPKNVTSRSSALTAFSVPKGYTASQVRATLKAMYKVQTAAGLGKDYKESVIRIGHMGYVYPKDAIVVIGALESTLYKLGAIKKLGPGVAATMNELVKGE